MAHSILFAEKFLSRKYEEKKEMGLKGRKKVEEEFDRNIVIQKYLDEIADVQKMKDCC